MCEFCRKFGEGTKWYLNRKNYSDELLNSELTAKDMADILGFVDGTIIEILGGPKRQTFEEMSAALIDTLLPDTRDEGAKNLINFMLENSHGGQVVPLEDALKIVEIAREPITVQECYCRKYFGGEPEYTCMWFYPVSSLAEETRTWERHRKLSKEEAKDLLQELDSKGCYHAVYWAPVPIPVSICNCDPLYCISYRGRMAYGVRNAVLKSEYVATVNRELCNGCKDCMTRCHFGALRYSPTDEKVFVDILRCFGCGLCRAVCPTNAIELVARDSIPAVSGDY